MNILSLVSSSTTIVTLLLASYYDLKYREVPRATWLAAIFVAIPLSLWQWADLTLDNSVVGILDAAIVILVVILSFSLHIFRGFNYGDFIGLSVTFLSFMYGIYPLYILLFTGIWFIIFSSFKLVDTRIPFLVPLTCGVVMAVVLYR